VRFFNRRVGEALVDTDNCAARLDPNRADISK